MKKQEIIYHLLEKYRDGDETAGKQLDEMYEAEMFEQHINDEYEGGWNSFSSKYKYIEGRHRALYDGDQQILTEKQKYNRKKRKSTPSNPFI